MVYLWIMSTLQFKLRPGEDGFCCQLLLSRQRIPRMRTQVWTDYHDSSYPCIYKCWEQKFQYALLFWHELQAVDQSQKVLTPVYSDSSLCCLFSPSKHHNSDWVCSRFNPACSKTQSCVMYLSDVYDKRSVPLCSEGKLAQIRSSLCVAIVTMTNRVTALRSLLSLSKEGLITC